MKNKIAYTIARILLGLVFFLSGIVKLLPSMPQGQLPEKAMAFTTAMASTGYFMPFLGLSEMVVGALLLLNWFVPLAMMILSPIMLNIVLFVGFLSFTIGGMAFIAVLVLMQLYIMYCTWDSYKSVLAKKRAIK